MYQEQGERQQQEEVREEQVHSNGVVGRRGEDERRSGKRLGSCCGKLAASAAKQSANAARPTRASRGRLK